ncbi:MAG: hypothetical protein ABUK01_01220 [Leptospirales bacterium]
MTCSIKNSFAIKLITLFLLWGFTLPIYSEPLAWQTWNAQQVSDSSENDDTEYTETPFRRGEIVFFLALPFIALANILVFSSGYYIYDPTYDFTLGALPTWYLITMGASTVTLTLLIAIKDAKNNREPTNFDNLNNRPGINLGLSKKF